MELPAGCGHCTETTDSSSAAAQKKSITDLDHQTIKPPYITNCVLIDFKLLWPTELCEQKQTCVQF